jgi:SAM-dependent methyltransferase
VYKLTVTEADLARLQEERERADRAYNDALTALDRALIVPRPLPGAAAPPDASQLDRLGRLWQIVPQEPVPFTGWKARLGTFVWRMVGPMLQRQQEFNAALVDHANRSAQGAAEAAEAVGRLSAAVAVELQALATLQARLIGYLQQITLYVDTKDRSEVGALRWEVEHRGAGLAAGLSALGDELLRRWEAVQTRDQRFEARLAELRASLARGERMAPARQDNAIREVVVPSVTPAKSADAQRLAMADTREASAVYAGFEDAFRGSPEDLKDRLAAYLPLFAGASNVVDLGCGRGEFLQLLGEHGVTARGVDINGEMVARCRAQGLDAVESDALQFLAGTPDASLGGLFAAQVVEHLQPDRLLELLALARRKLAPDARIVLETVNPACWYAFFSSYIRDITHVRALHPETLRYLLTASGFEAADIRYSSPYPTDYKLHRLPETLRAEGPALAGVVEEFNGNVEKLNELLFTYLDYAAIGSVPSA